MSIIRATLRLQFHRDFTLDHAVPLVEYFAALGISHIYASPLLSARPGSQHCYDVVDPTTINPELGGEPALRRLVAALRQHDMGLILDIVSNHMAVGGSANPWWLDVLEWGQRSPYAEFFDIEWNSPDPALEGQLLVPFLRTDYGEALQAGEIPLYFDASRGAFYAQHHEHYFPISPPSYGELLSAAEHPALSELAVRFEALKNQADAYQAAIEARAELASHAERANIREALQQTLSRYDSRQEDGLRRLHALLERQHYRLASWRTAAADVNWRRFFDINELGALRVERPAVFEATHGKIFQLISEGLIDGLRIDHIDGLADPRGYCRKLRRRVDRLLSKRPSDAQLSYFPIYVEKILGHGEHLHLDWTVDGTTGYEFMNQVSLLQHDIAGGPPLAALWNAISGRPPDFLEEVRQARQLVLTNSLASDFETVAQNLLQMARGNLMTRDLTLGAIRRALLELIVHFPVYRTYINACGRPKQDEPFFQQALQGACDSLSEADWSVLEQLQRWLGGEQLRHMPPGPWRRLRQHVCARFQQLTAPTAAKAVEDTAFYRSAVLLSRNDVGFDAEHFGASVEAFHNACQHRESYFPDNLLTTATHDHKRGEDLRARLAVISERATWFGERARHWLMLAEPLRHSLADGPAPSPGDELMLYQTLLGGWPLGLTGVDVEGLKTFAERLQGWQQKAVREAKLRSSWNAPNEAYETICRDYLQTLLLNSEGAALRSEISQAASAIAPAGVLNSLSQTLLRLTTPGVPDLYQGTEFWDFSLVDPDNRQPVDYRARRAALSETSTPAELLRNWTDARLKQFLIARTLRLRQALPELFHYGSYRPLRLIGDQADHALAFARLLGERAVVVIVPRLPAALLGDIARPLIPSANWGDTQVELPEPLRDKVFGGLFSSQTVITRQGLLSLGALLADFPVCLLCSESRLTMETGEPK